MCIRDSTNTVLSYHKTTPLATKEKSKPSGLLLSVSMQLCANPLCAARDIGQLDAFRLEFVADPIGLGKILRLLGLKPCADLRFDGCVLFAGFGDDVVLAAACLGTGRLFARLFRLDVYKRQHLNIKSAAAHRQNVNRGVSFQNAKPAQSCFGLRG